VTGATGPPGFSLASVNLTRSSANAGTFYTLSASTGIPTTNKIWLAGFSNAGQTDAGNDITQLYVSASGGTWVANMGILFNGENNQIDYVIPFYYG
jgi:hypothetical protein